MIDSEILLPGRSPRGAPDGQMVGGQARGRDDSTSCTASDRARLPTPQMAVRRPRGEGGYSLIEVLAASGLLLAVLLAIMGMFVYGGRSVNAGKMMTKASSISGDVLEELRKIGLRQVPTVVEDQAGWADLTSVTWNSTNNLPNYPDDAAAQARLAAWAAQVKTGLPQGQITITMRGLANLGTANADPDEATFTNAGLIQIVVTVRWTEVRRQRSVVFETLRS
jgi:Tfp pilus assembly protein PilV